MKYVFVADFFENQIRGGAEKNDNALIKYLQEECFAEVVLLNSNLSLWQAKSLSSERWVIGNRTMMSHDVMNYIQNHCEYVIYEHDCQFVKNRDVSVYVDFKGPKSMQNNLKFYQNAMAVVCLSKAHKRALDINMPSVNTMSIGTSLWTEEDFLVLEQTEA